MSLLIESIKLLDGEYFNLFYHEQRIFRTLHALYGVSLPPDLTGFLSKITRPEKGLYKCRVVYDDKTMEVEFISYQPKTIRTLRIVESSIAYDYKFRDRSEIDELFSRRGDCDDILIAKHGAVTDTSYCNIVFKKDNAWYTPSGCLLRGTMRQSLIERKIIIPVTISVKDIRSFQSFRLINAMLEFEGSETDVSQIVL